MIAPTAAYATQSLAAIGEFGTNGMRFIIVAGAAACSAVLAYPVYLYALGAQQRRESVQVLAQFDRDCGLARRRLAGGGEFWSARIMANRCEAAGR